MVIAGSPSGRPTNPRWRTAAILKKNVKSPYVCDRSIDFDEIWHDDAYWPLAADQLLKFWIFENPKWRRPPSWKSQKSRYLRNGLLDLYEIWYGAVKNEFQKSKNGSQKTVKSPYLCNLFDRFWLNLAQWCMLIPSAWRKVEIFNSRQSYTADRRHLANRKTALIYFVITQWHITQFWQ